ncbi:MAG: hypothetical protein IKX20_02990 [Paludibacteraceae bacterium]|nr:hypothetical protein [Paludibacteraceae bacterium]
MAKGNSKLSKGGGGSTPVQSVRVNDFDVSKATGEYIAQTIYAVYRDRANGKSIVGDVNLVNMTSGKRKNAISKAEKNINIIERNLDAGRGDAADLQRQLELWRRVINKLNG